MPFLPDALRLALTQIVSIPGVMQNFLSRHEQLYKAISARDADLAEAITKAHLERLANLTKEVLGDVRVGEANRSAGAANAGLFAEAQSLRAGDFSTRAGRAGKVIIARREGRGSCRPLALG